MRCGQCSQWEAKDGKAWCPHIKDFIDEYDEPEDLKCDQFGIGKSRDFPEPDFSEEEEGEDFFGDESEGESEVKLEEGEDGSQEKPIAEENENPEEVDPIGEVLEDLYETGASLEDAMTRVRRCIESIEAMRKDEDKTEE